MGLQAEIKTKTFPKEKWVGAAEKVKMVGGCGNGVGR